MKGELSFKPAIHLPTASILPVGHFPDSIRHLGFKIKAAKRRFNVEIQEFVCYHFGTVIKSVNCSFNKISTNFFMTNVNVVLNNDLARDSEVRILISFQLPKNNKIITFLDVKLNICDFLSQIMGTPLVKRLMKEVRKTGNLPYACPVKGNYRYYFANYSVTDDLLPPYTPLMKFNFSLSYFEHKKLFASSCIRGSTVPNIPDYYLKIVGLYTTILQIVFMKSFSVFLLMDMYYTLLS
ncbi:uncharacterized protein LOC142239487 [Haematobia irritans]|uniref:uncharacterized protein LOC142239487 n=1 Tax=Haematobia irritans TaxID=7368 RepID=UPI003F50C342